MGEYEQISEIQKDYNKVKSLLDQRDILKLELKELLERVKALEIKVSQIEPIVNELQCSSNE